MVRTFAIGMDLGGTNARAAAVDPDGKLLHVTKSPLTDRSPEAAADALAACVRQVLAQDSLKGATCTAYGVGLAAQLDAQTGRVIVAPNLGWRDLDFAALVQARVGHPVSLGNDLAVAAIGESTAGAARGYKHAVLVFVGSGVGSALILGGKLHRGARGVAGELGHTKVRPGGRLCGCGERGCLEAYTGGHNMGALVMEAIQSGRSSSLKGRVPEGLRPPVSMIDAAADEGDALAREIRDDAAMLIGVAAANLITELNPAVLILGGGVMSGAPTLRSQVEEILRANAGRAALAQCLIVSPALGDDAGVIGAAFLSAH
jgi:glucokinase